MFLFGQAVMLLSCTTFPAARNAEITWEQFISICRSLSADTCSKNSNCNTYVRSLKALGLKDVFVYGKVFVAEGDGNGVRVDPRPDNPLEVQSAR
jgi:hypothetical protein